MAKHWRRLVSPRRQCAFFEHTAMAMRTWCGDRRPGPSPSTGKADITPYKGASVNLPPACSAMLKFLAWPALSRGELVEPFGLAGADLASPLQT